MSVSIEKLQADLAARDALIEELRQGIEFAFARSQDPTNALRLSSLQERMRALLARTPADAGTELARLRENNADLAQRIQETAEHTQRDQEEAESRERKINELVDLAHAERQAREKAEARLRAVTEAGDLLKARLTHYIKTVNFPLDTDAVNTWRAAIDAARAQDEKES